MPQPLQSSGKVDVTGLLGFGDIHTIHGNQLQPAFVWVDHMGGTVVDVLKETSNLSVNRLTGVVHAAQIFVPFHQVLATQVADDGVYRSLNSTGANVLWTEFNYGTVSPKHTAYGDGMYGCEFFEAVLPETAVLSDANNMDTTYTSTQWKRTGSGDATDWDDQGFTLFLQKQKLGYVSWSTPQFIYVDWWVFANGADKTVPTTNPAKFRLILEQGKLPLLTCDGVEMRTSIGFGNSAMGITGDMPSINISMMQQVQVMIIGGRMQVTITGLAQPIVLKLDRLWGATVCGIPVNKDNEPQSAYAYMPKDASKRFPAGGTNAFMIYNLPFDAYMWPSGQSPVLGPSGNTQKIRIKKRWRAGATWDLDAPQNKDFDAWELDATVGGYATAFVNDAQIGVLEPRIGRVELRYKGFSQYSFHLHPMRFASSFSYTSIDQQLGFTPDLSQPSYLPKFDVHMHGDTGRNMESGVAHQCQHVTGGLVTVNDEHIPLTQISRYSLDFQNTNTTEVIAFAGQNTQRYTPGIERVSIRYPGITEFEPVEEGDFSIFPIGEGSNNCAEWLVGITEESMFDFAAMRVQQSVNLTFNNYIGMSQFAANTGVNGAGNISVGWRWGYKHSAGIQSQEGEGWWTNPGPNPGDPPTPTYGPGWSRLVGFCDTYAYTGASGRYAVMLACKSMISRLDDTVFHAPPNMDGWNHFRAVYTLLSMAGIPDSRIYFKTDDPQTNMVPDDPYGLEPADPDYATGGYFLPIGVGSNPWTPIARSMTTGQLLAMIQQVTQFVLFVDEQGRWRYQPFMQDASGIPKRIFREYYPYDSNQGLTQMWDVNVTFSTADTRNEVILVGLDAFGGPLTYLDPIFYAKRDEMSINAPVGQQPANYVGWKKNFAMVDSRYATYDFAQKTAEKLYKTMRQPAILVTFSCWGQPDIYPMDFIGVEYQRSGLSGFPAILGVSEQADNTLPLFVTKISTTITRTANGLIPQSRIEARYLPLDGYQDIGNGISTVGKTEGDADNTQSDEGGSGTGTVG